MAATLTIDRLSLHLDVAATPDRAAVVAQRVGGDLRRALPAALARIPLERRDIDMGHVFIDRVPVECDVSSAWPVDLIADLVSRRFMLALSTLLAEPNGAGTTFRDEVEHLASFLSHLVSGTAWERWWFREFDGLRPLGVSTALRTAIINAGEDGVLALTRLTPDSASRVLGALAHDDAARVLDAVAERDGTLKGQLLAIWDLAAQLSEAEVAHPRGRLVALVAIARRAPRAAGRLALEALEAFVGWRRRSRALPARLLPQELPRAALLALSAEPESSDGPATSTPAWLEGRSEGDGELASLVAAICDLATSDPPRAAGRRESSGDAVPTRAGGVLLLLDLLCRLDWPNEWATALRSSARKVDGDALARALALAVSARAFGAAPFERDEALLVAAGANVESRSLLRRHGRLLARALRGPTRPRSESAGLGAWTARHAQALLKQLAARLPGLSGSTPSYLRQNVLRFGASVEVFDGRVTARLGRSPLDVLLVFAGYKRGSWRLPGGPEVTVAAEGAIA
jgi:hypothetical protein